MYGSEFVCNVAKELAPRYHHTGERQQLPSSTAKCHTAPYYAQTVRVCLCRRLARKCEPHACVLVRQAHCTRQYTGCSQLKFNLYQRMCRRKLPAGAQTAPSMSLLLVVVVLHASLVRATSQCQTQTVPKCPSQVYLPSFQQESSCWREESFSSIISSLA